LFFDGRILVITRKVHHGEARVHAQVNSRSLRLGAELCLGLNLIDPKGDIGIPAFLFGV